MSNRWMVFPHLLRSAAAGRDKRFRDAAFAAWAAHGGVVADVLPLLSRCEPGLAAQVAAGLLLDPVTGVEDGLSLLPFCDRATVAAWWVGLPVGAQSDVCPRTDAEAAALWPFLGDDRRAILVLALRAGRVPMRDVAAVLCEHASAEEKWASPLGEYAAQLVGLVPDEMIAWALLHGGPSRRPGDRDDVWRTLAARATAAGADARHVGWLVDEIDLEANWDDSESQYLAAVLSYRSPAADALKEALIPSLLRKGTWAASLESLAKQPDGILAWMLRCLPEFARGPIGCDVADVCGAGRVLRALLSVPVDGFDSAVSVFAAHAGLSAAASELLVAGHPPMGRVDFLAGFADRDLLARLVLDAPADVAARVMSGVGGIADMVFELVVASGTDPESLMMLSYGWAGSLSELAVAASIVSKR